MEGQKMLKSSKTYPVLRLAALESLLNALHFENSCSIRKLRDCLAREIKQRIQLLGWSLAE
jgi:hypothetical protein